MIYRFTDALFSARSRLNQQWCLVTRTHVGMSTWKITRDSFGVLPTGLYCSAKEKSRKVGERLCVHVFMRVDVHTSTILKAFSATKSTQKELCCSRFHGKFSSAFGKSALPLSTDVIFLAKGEKDKQIVQYCGDKYLWDLKQLILIINYTFIETNSINVNTANHN